MSLLLEKGANVNAEGGYYGNALQAATYRGTEGLCFTVVGEGSKCERNARMLWYCQCTNVVSLLKENRAFDDCKCKGKYL